MFLFCEFGRKGWGERKISGGPAPIGGWYFVMRLPLVKSVKSPAHTWADTTSAHGRLMLIILGGLAEFERKLIRARTGEGRKRAQARGVKFGRPSKLNPHQRREAMARLNAGDSQGDVARSYGVARTTIGRLLPAPAT